MFTYEMYKASGRITIQATHTPSREVIGSAFIYGNVMKSIWVDPDYRRQGVATGMWRFAEASELHPVHADSQTELGRLWIASL